MPVNHRKRYSVSDRKQLKNYAALCKNKQDILIIAPLIAQNMGRTTCGICKQLENILNIPWYIN